MSAYTVHRTEPDVSDDIAARRHSRLRKALFLGVFLIVAGGGLVYDYSRPATYRAQSRLSVDPPGGTDDAITKAQFAINEVQALRRSEILQTVAEQLKASAGDAALTFDQIERRLNAEAVAQTNVIALRAEGRDRNVLTAALSYWIDAYMKSRKEVDLADESEALLEARHGLKVAQAGVEGKRREMEAFRQRHGIVSIEREENPGAARLKGLHGALNDAATREVNTEAKLKAVNDSLAAGKGVIRAADKAVIGNLEMRAVDLRERMKDLEHDFTAQYLAMDPKYKALKANLARVEQQIEQERDRSRKAALIEAQEEFASAQRASEKIREQADGLKRESQSFSTHFVELRRMGTELEQLQDQRKAAQDRLSKLDSARKPTAVRIQVISAPFAAEEAISPNYSRDASIALAAGFVLAIVAVWLMDYLRRKPDGQTSTNNQPIIQIAYPMLHPPPQPVPVTLQAPVAHGFLPQHAMAQSLNELGPVDVGALWAAANSDQRLIVAALFSGLSMEELGQLRWRHVDLSGKSIDVVGAFPRRLSIREPLHQELVTRAVDDSVVPDSALIADVAGNALDPAKLDAQIVYLAHDAGIRRADEVRGETLQYTYCAYLARQGIRITELAATFGRIVDSAAQELMRLTPPGQPLASDRIDWTYPAFRSQGH